MTADTLLAGIYGGVLVGVGTALVFKAHASTGGSDLLAQIFKEFKVNYRISEIMLFIDSAVILANVIVFKNIEIGLYSAIVVFIVSKMIDLVFEGINFGKAIYIISSKAEEISVAIANRIERGTTGIYARGMYEEKDKMVLLCVVNKRQLPKVKEISKKIDKEAFIIISNVREVLGEGFKKE